MVGFMALTLVLMNVARLHFSGPGFVGAGGS